MLKHKLTVLAAALCGALVISGCSSTSSREPAELEDVRELVQGDELWSENLGATEGSLLTPAVTSNGIYGAGGNELYRIDPETGDVVWKQRADADISAGVGSDGTYVAVGTVKGEVEVYDSDGKRLWTARLSSEVSVPPLVGSGFVFVRTADTRITAATDVGGRSPKTLVALGKKREAAVPGVGTSSQERILRFAPAGDALNPAMVTAVARELAARCGLSVVEGGLMGSAGYLEARFDRTPEGAHVFVQSAATLVRRKRRSRAQPMAAAAGYLDAADILNREGADAAGDLKELFGRLLFNALIGNNRDRLDQIWLTPTSSGVKLLPMYAPTATPTPATGGRQLSTPIRGTGTIVAPEAVVANARYFGLSSARAKMLCLEFTQIVSGWREVAQAVGADFFTVSQMARLFEQ